jgi:hypothetical protein
MGSSVVKSGSSLERCKLHSLGIPFAQRSLTSSAWQWILGLFLNTCGGSQGVNLSAHRQAVNRGSRRYTKVEKFIQSKE